MNATELAKEFRCGEFDCIIFFACLEHMHVKERLAALSHAWGILEKGGMLGVIEMPNRFWFDDRHTSLLPFFHWLPDELAFEYSRFSTRENFCEIYREGTAASVNHFLRRGRGVSFHEFDLAIQPVGSLNIVGSLSAFCEQNGLTKSTAAHMDYMSLLQQQCPAVSKPFFEEYLNFVIQKL